MYRILLRGAQTGDKIVEMAGTPVKTFEETWARVGETSGQGLRGAGNPGCLRKICNGCKSSTAWAEHGGYGSSTGGRACACSSRARVEAPSLAKAARAACGDRLRTDDPSLSVPGCLGYRPGELPSSLGLDSRELASRA